MPKSLNLQYIFAPLAKEDLLNISLKGLEEWGADQAASYVAKIDDCLGMIANNPSIGTKRDELFTEAYSFPIGKHTIIYRQRDSFIEVSRILHQRMDVNRYFS